MYNEIENYDREKSNLNIFLNSVSLFIRYIEGGLKMNNLKRKNIYIINIAADQLANPNWSIEVKQSRFEQDVGIHIEYLKQLTDDQINVNDTDVNREDFLAFSQEEHDRIFNPESRTDFYKINEEKRDSLYNESLPVSLDILKLQKLYPHELYTLNEKSKKHKPYKGDFFSNTESAKLYTEAIINVTFDRASYKMTSSPKVIDKVSKNKIKTR
jgi:hypothetical protein